MQPFIVPGTLESLSAIGNYVNTIALEAGLDKKVAYRLRLAVDEIATNIIVHGYQETGLSGEVIIKSEIEPDTLTIILEDTSPPFDPRGLGRPSHIDKPVHERPIGGLGIYLTVESVDRFDYEYVNKHNRNIFVIKRPTNGGLPV